MNLIKVKENTGSFDRKGVIILAVIFLLIMLPQIYLWDHITDDAYISFRYAERLINGQGLTFNNGEKVEGFSNPLWIFLISIGKQLTQLDVSIIARILGLFSSLGIIFFSYLIAKSLFDIKKAYSLLIFCSTVLFFTPGFHVYNTSGLEGPFLGFLLISISYFSISELKQGVLIASILMGMVCIVRPEGPLYGLIWLILTINFNSYSIFKKIIRVALVFSPVIVYGVFRIIYFGQILPNTFYAKPTGTYSYLFGIDETLIYLTTLSLPLILILGYHHFSNPNPQKKFFLTISGILLANFIFVIYANGDWMFFGRFFLPVWPILLLAFSYLLLEFIYSLSKDLFKFNYISALCLISIIITLIVLFKTQWFEYYSNSNYANLMKGKDQLAVGSWLNKLITPGSTVAAFRLGGISYGAPKLTFYDTYGLTDKEITEFRKTKSGYDIYENPVIKRDPDVLALLNQFGHRMITVEPISGLEEYLEKKYDFIKSFKQGTGISFEIWINKKKKNKILSLKNKTL